ncbi:MAG: hypothetical protein Q4F30_06205 [Akkermansia sp.]|nr:hypothetical protein [Akkermansia sp.]
MSPATESAARGILLPCISNFQDQEVKMSAPWATSIRARSTYVAKPVFKAYLTKADTRDCLFSGIRGMSPNLRVSHQNPPAAIMAVVADYDTPMTDEERQKKLARLTHKPNFIARSFSGGTRAVWLLEKPLPLMPGDEMVQALLRTIARELSVTRAFGPVDANAFYNTSQYYHAGWEWVETGAAPVPANLSILWLDAALKKSRDSRQGIEIPLDRVWAEMERRGWAGRWGGEFGIGSRGVRFWDETADNPTAAIVTETGMVCFTGHRPFMSWEAIFGKGIVDEYRADTLGKALSECYFVNNTFYVYHDFQGGDGASTPGWLTLNRQGFELMAAEKYGLGTKAEKDGGESPVKQLMAKIITLNALPSACPLIYRKERIVHVQNEPRLNTSFLRVHEPDADKGRSWGDGFPWIASFMERLFPDIIQRERFMAAWAWAYRNAYYGHPRNGHTLFVAGGVGAGKNFLTDCLYGPSMGGCADASEYILGQTRFNEHLMGVGVWTLNDTVTKGDYKERAQFAKALKKMSANHLHMCEGKFKNASGIYWSGRIIVTLNTDPDSLQMLPDIELSNRDKISLFKTTDTPMDDAGGRKKAAAEMGALCAFLLNWELPEHCRGDARWGVRNFLHPELLAEAMESGSSSSFREILTLFVKSMFDADKALEALEGSATWFMQQMMLTDGVSGMLHGEVNARSMGRRLGALASSGDYPIVPRRKARERIWHIGRKEFMDYLENPAEEGGLDELCPF